VIKYFCDQLQSLLPENSLQAACLKFSIYSSGAMEKYIKHGESLDPQTKLKTTEWNRVRGMVSFEYLMCKGRRALLEPLREMTTIRACKGGSPRV
jgi:hypothetical protein